MRSIFVPHLSQGSPVRPYEYRYWLKYPVFPVEVLSEALELWPSRRGDRHYEVAVQLHNLAAVQHGIRLEQAEEFGIDAVALRYAHSSRPCLFPQARGLGQ